MSLFWVGLLAPLGVSFAAGNPADGVLAKMRAASGGARWEAVRTLHLSTTATHGGEEEHRDHWEDVRTGRFLLRVSGPHSSRQTGFDGITPWIQGRSGIPYAFGDRDSLLGAADEAYQVARAWWFPERHAATVAWIGTRSKEGRRYDVLSVTPAGGRPFEAWVDRSTHLLALTREEQAEGVVVTGYSDYRVVQGLRLPFEIRTGDGDDPKFDLVERVQSVEVNPVTAEDLYALPPRPRSDITFPANTDSVEVPFRIALNNRILVPITVDGHSVEAWFDSGGSLLLQPATVADLAVETRGQHKLSGGGEGAGITSIGRLDTLAIGGAKVAGLSFHSFPFYPDDPREALVGLEVLQRFVVRLDFDRQVMTLTRPEAFHDSGKGVAVPFHFQENQPEVTGSIDGIAGHFAIDTGDTGSLLLIAPFARRYDLVKRYQGEIPYDGRSVGATHGVFARKRVHTVAFNGVAGRPVAHVEDPVTRISLQHAGFDANRYVSANIGLGILRRFNLTFDYSRQRILFEPNHAYGEKDSYNRTGFKLTRDGASWKIDVVYPSSPASRAGLQEGDTVEQINGKTAGALDKPALARVLKEPEGTRVTLVVRGSAGTRKVELTLQDVF